MLKEILHTKDTTSFAERLKRAASKSRDSVTTTIVQQVTQLDEIIRFEAASRQSQTVADDSKCSGEKSSNSEDEGLSLHLNSTAVKPSFKESQQSFVEDRRDYNGADGSSPDKSYFTANEMSQAEKVRDYELSCQAIKALGMKIKDAVQQDVQQVMIPVDKLRELCDCVLSAGELYEKLQILADVLAA